MNSNAVYPRNWYVIAESREVGRKPVELKRFGTGLVAWRDSQGTLSVMRDLCPHRSVKLSRGAVCGDTLECCFHGFRFGRDGACQFVPEIKRDAPGLKVETYRSCEKYGFIWVWWPDGEPGNAQPGWFDEIKEDMVCASLSQVWRCPVTRCIENQLDYAHLPFLHRSSIGRGFDPSRQAYVELTSESISFRFEEDTSKPHALIAFRMPNVWINKIAPSYVLMLAFVPIDENYTKFYVRTYQNFLKIPLLSGLVTGVMNQINRFVLREDQNAVESHPAGLSSTQAPFERLFPSDRAIRHFRSLWVDSRKI